MAWSKRQIVEKIYGELALAGYDFDLSAEEMQAALTTLDTMLAEWDSQGIQIGYAFGTTPDDSDLDQDSGLPLQTVSAVYLNGAVRVAASKGKQLADSTLKVAKQAYDVLLSRSAREQLLEQPRRDGTPRGAGNKRRTCNPFFPRPDTDALLGSDDGLTFTGN